MTVYVAVTGIVVSTLLACWLVVVEVRRSNRIVQRAKRIAVVPEPMDWTAREAEVFGPYDWAAWDEVFS